MKRPLNILSIDTSTKNFSLAVSSGTKILHSRNVKLRHVLSQSIMPAIERILQKSKIPLSAVDGFAVGLGPGSFTSLRVGLATVKGLAFATRRPIVGIPSLDVLARGASEDGVICALCDAKRNLVYSCLYEKRGAVLKRKSRYLLTDIKDVLKRIKGDVTFVGDGVPLFREAIEKAVGTKARFAGEKQMYPQAKHLAIPAMERFKAKKYDNVETLVPFYLYPEDCQVQKSRK